MKHKYWAFISYSHQDEAWAQWLHRALEAYRVPQRLVGRPLGPSLERETIPRRLFPIFRDRDELPSSHELGATLTQALKDSRNLIVICSPRSAASRWVNEEIKAFRALGRSHSVYCLIVDGEPNASGDSAHNECFAPALRGDAGFEPIAADARERKDGKSGAKLKLIAGLINVGLDELKQREKQRQFWQRAQMGGAVAAMLAAAVTGWRWFEHRETARTLETRIEKLYDAGRRELLNHYETRAAVYLAEAYRLGRDTPALRFMLGQAMQVTDAQSDVILETGGPVRRPAYSADSHRIITPTQTAAGTVAQIWDAASGHRLALLKDLPAAPLLTRFLDSERVLVSGFQKELLEVSRGEGAFTGIWSTSRSELLARFEGHTGRFGQPVDQSARWLIAADATDHRGARVWDLARGTLRRTLDPGVRVLAASLSPNGHYAVTGDETGAVQLWDLAATGGFRRLPGRLPYHVIGVLFTADARRIVALGRKGDVRVWDAASGALELSFAADPSGIADLALTPDGGTLITAGIGGYKFWDLRRGILLFARGKNLTQWSSITLTADGALAAATDDSQPAAELLHLPGQSLLLRLEQNAPVSAAAFSADGQQMLTATEQGQVRLWRLPLRLLNVFRHEKRADKESPLMSARFDPQGGRILTVGFDGTLRLWSWAEGQVLRQFEEGAVVLDARFSPLGDRIASQTADGVMRLRDAQTLQPIRTIKRLALWNPFEPLQFSPDGRYFASLPDAANPGVSSIEIWNAAVGSSLHTLDLGCAPSALKFTGDSARLIAGCTSGQLQIWNLQTGARQRDLPGFATHLRTLALGGDPEWVAAFADGDPLVRMWNSATGESAANVAVPAPQLPNALALAPLTAELAVSTNTGAILVTRRDSTVPKMLDAQAPVNALRYLPNGLLLSYRADNSVKVWDTQRGELISDFSFNGSMVWTAETDAAGAHLLTGGLDGLAAIVKIESEPRSPEVVQTLLRCRSPWALSGDSLIANPDPRCPANAEAAPAGT